MTANILDGGQLMARTWKGSIHRGEALPWHSVVRHGGYGPFVTNVTTLCGIEMTDALVEYYGNFDGPKRMCKRCEAKAA